MLVANPWNKERVLSALETFKEEPAASKEATRLKVTNLVMGILEVLIAAGALTASALLVSTLGPLAWGIAGIGIAISLSFLLWNVRQTVSFLNRVQAYKERARQTFGGQQAVHVKSALFNEHSSICMDKRGEIADQTERDFANQTRETVLKTREERQQKQGKLCGLLCGYEREENKTRFEQHLLLEEAREPVTAAMEEEIPLFHPIAEKESPFFEEFVAELSKPEHHDAILCCKHGVEVSVNWRCLEACIREGLPKEEHVREDGTREIRRLFENYEALVVKTFTDCLADPWQEMTLSEEELLEVMDLAHELGSAFIDEYVGKTFREREKCAFMDTDKKAFETLCRYISLRPWPNYLKTRALMTVSRRHSQRLQELVERNILGDEESQQQFRAFLTKRPSQRQREFLAWWDNHLQASLNC